MQAAAAVRSDTRARARQLSAALDARRGAARARRALGGPGSSAPAPRRPRRTRSGAGRSKALTRHGSSPRSPDARRPARVMVYRAGCPASGRRRESSRARAPASSRARAEATVVPWRSARASAVTAPMRATHWMIATRSGEGVWLSRTIATPSCFGKVPGRLGCEIQASMEALGWNRAEFDPWAVSSARTGSLSTAAGWRRCAHADAVTVAQPDHRRPALPETHDLIRAEDALTGAGACQPSVAVARGSPGALRSGQARDQLGRVGDDLAVGNQHRQVAHDLLEQPLAPWQAQIGELLACPAPG